jgi:hypothetical protein
VPIGVVAGVRCCLARLFPGSHYPSFFVEHYVPGPTAGSVNG